MNLFSFQDIIMSVMGILVLITLLLALFLVTPSKANLANQDAISELETALASGIRDADTQHATSVSLRVALAKMRDRPDTNQLASELAQVRGVVAVESNKLNEVNQQISGLEASRIEKIAKLGLNDLEATIKATIKQAQRVRSANEKDEVVVRKQEQLVSEARDSLATLKKAANKLWLIPSTKGNSKEPLLVMVSGGGIELNRFNRPEDKQMFPSGKAVSGLKQEMAGMNPAKDYVLFYIRPSGVKLFKACKEVTDESRFQIGFDAVVEKAQLIFTRDLE